MSVLTFGIVVYSYFEINASPKPEPQFFCGTESQIDKNLGNNVNGEKLFRNNCAACHNTSDETLIGPGLKNITERRPLDWIVKWVHNPQKVIKSGDKYATELFDKYNQAQMVAYPNLTEEDIDILKYIN
ncbi:cytochrome c [Arcicella sp. DC2W]|uniref:Cytochrome c n=1 Tax=Arcicella gelida TaxID=2984195 RepID=A0ABU5S5Y4_9BACT|nr:cytochrome c [Arcicella sp. DC2W]MEA5403653.1 cytochrome c [Arcicella sp. DC2W]